MDCSLLYTHSPSIVLESTTMQSIFDNIDVLQRLMVERRDLRQKRKYKEMEQLDEHMDEVVTEMVDISHHYTKPRKKVCTERDMKKKKCATKLVQMLGFESLHDSDTVIMRENIQNAFENLEPEFVRELGELYKNRVGERAAKGIKNRQEFMCLVRRVLACHGVTVVYTKRFKKRVVIFSYRLTFA